MSVSLRIGVSLVSIAAACSACSDPVQTSSVDRRAILRDLGAKVIVPVYDDFASAATELRVRTSSLCDAPDAEKLQAAQAAWRAARAPFKRAEAFEIGPVRDLRVENAVDFWPVREGDVQEVLADTSSITDQYVDGLGASKKGLPVLETLIFDEAGDNDRAVAGLIDGGRASRRCVYARALGRDVEQQAAMLAAAWKPGGGDFARELATAGDGSAKFQTLAQGIDAIVNAMIGLALVVEGDKLALPLGKRNGGVPQPSDVESPVSGNSTEDIADNLRGIQSTYLGSYEGTEGVSLAELVASLNPTLDMKMRAQLVQALTAVEAIPPPLSRAVVESPAKVEAAYDSTKALLRLIAVDMVGQLGVTTTFTDNDGD